MKHHAVVANTEDEIGVQCVRCGAWATSQFTDASHENRGLIESHVTAMVRRFEAEECNPMLGNRGIVKTVYVRDIALPEVIEQARVAAAQQEQILDKAQKQYAIDSVNARAELIKADAQAELTRIQASIYQRNPDMLKLELEKAKAQALGSVCKGVTTCIIGGSVMDTWKGVP